MKKVFQHFFGKITILVCLLFAFTQQGNAQITVATANCTITANEVQMDILLINTGANDLRWNSPVLRMIVPAGMLPVGGTYSFQCVGAGDFPLSWPAVLPANAFGANYAAGTRTITWTTGNTSAYNNLTCAAPLIPSGATRTMGRFSFKCTNNNFVAGANATFTWSTTTACQLYQTVPTCATAVSGFNNTSTGLLARTLAAPCVQTVPSSCTLTATNTTTSVCGANTDGTATVTLAGASAGAPGTYTVNGGAVQTFTTNPFTVTGLAAGSYTIAATVTSNGCTASTVAEVVSNPFPIAQISNDNGLALNCTTPSTTLTASGGGTYSWSNGATTPSITVSTAGTWTVTVTGVGGCTATASATTTLDNTPPSASIANDNGLALTCAVPSTTLTASGGGTYSWSNGATTPSITVTTAGTWTVTVTGTNGCTATASATTTLDNTPPAASIANDNGLALTCAVPSTTLTASGGGTYSWSNGATTPSITVSTAGTWTVTVTGTNGCTATASATTTLDNTVPTVSFSGLAATYCSDASAVTLTGSPSGGTFSGPGITGNSFDPAAAGPGTHSITYSYTSGGGCTGSETQQVTVNAALTGTGTATAISCSGSTDGTATITLSSSTSGTYTVDGGSAIPYATNPFTITGLAAGPHTIVATSGGCSSNLIGVTVGSTAQLTGTGTTTPTTCGNPTSGTATITLSGSTSGTYTVDGGSAQNYSSNPFTVTGLTNGPHTIIATSAAGCVSDNILVTVGSSATFTATVVKTNISACNAGNDGTISITPNGGIAPFTYIWSGGYPGFAPGNVSSVSNLPIGFYNVTVISSGGCGTVTFTNIHIQYAFNVYVTHSGSNSSSCGSTGSILLYGNAGITPYTYALSPGTGQPTPAPGAFQSSNAFTGLAAGAYTAFVKDAGGCVSPKNVTVGSAAAIVVTTSTVGASSCAADGSIQIFRTGGIPPYSYSIDGTNYQTSPLFTGLASGPYTAYAKDAAGCIGQVNTAVAAGTGLTATVSKVNSSTCVNDGSIQVNAAGGVPAYSYSLNGGTYQSSNSFPNLGAGNYTVQVKDSKGCLSPEYNVTINLNTIVVTASATASTSCSSNNGKIQLFRTGGYGPYTYSLDGNTYQTSTLFTGLTPGTYTGYVKDSKTCIGLLAGIVVGPVGCPPPPFAGNNNTNAKQSQVSVKTAALQVQAYPNPTESEFTLVLQGYNAKEKVSIIVTDLLGRKVYQTEGTGKLLYRFGTNFKAGMYNVQVLQGTEKASVKLVKE